MPTYTENQEQQKQAMDALNKMSDHNVLHDKKSNTFYYNAQSPYTIIPQEKGGWKFDIPSMSDYLRSVQNAQNSDYLSKLTGLEEADCWLLIEAMHEDHKNKNYNSVNFLFDEWSKEGNHVGIGAKLGEGGKRYCIETLDAFEQRSQKIAEHFDQAIQTTDEDAIIALVEQPYSPQSKKISPRYKSAEISRRMCLSKSMFSIGYTLLPSINDENPSIRGEVGIWVKTSKYDEYLENINNARQAQDYRQLETLVGNDTFRGEIAVCGDRIIICVHPNTRGKSIEEFLTNDCVSLINNAIEFAENNNKKLSISGDFNLFALNKENVQVKKLLSENADILQLQDVKGQERVIKKGNNPSQELIFSYDPTKDRQNNTKSRRINLTDNVNNHESKLKTTFVSSFLSAKSDKKSKKKYIPIIISASAFLITLSIPLLSIPLFASGLFIPPLLIAGCCTAGIGISMASGCYIYNRVTPQNSNNHEDDSLVNKPITIIKEAPSINTDTDDHVILEPHNPQTKPRASR